MKKNSNNLIFLLIFFVMSQFLISCTVPKAYHAYPPNLKPTTPSKIYEASLDKVFDATMKAFDNAGLDIFKTDKKTGYVEGGFTPGFGSSAQTWGAFIESVSQNRVKVSIDYQKGVWGSAFHKDRTEELFEEIDEEFFSTYMIFCNLANCEEKLYMRGLFYNL